MNENNNTQKEQQEDDGSLSFFGNSARRRKQAFQLQGNDPAEINQPYVLGLRLHRRS